MALNNYGFQTLKMASLIKDKFTEYILFQTWNRFI